MIRLGVLISGSGTNLQAILDAIAAGRLDAEVALVASSRPDAHGLVRAERAGVPTLALSQPDWVDAEAANRRIALALKAAGVDYVVLAGFMRKLLPPLLSAFDGRIVNLHPALLPAFPGAHGIADAWACGVKVTGVTVHFVDAGYDTGPIIAQRAVEVREDDDIESLEERIHAAEHELLPAVLELLAAGRVATGPGRRVRIHA